MKQAIRALCIFFILVVRLIAHNEPIQPRLEFINRLKHSFSLFFLPTSAAKKTISNLEKDNPIEIDKAIADKYYPGWRFADQEIQNYVHQITQDPSVIVIQANLDNPFASNQSPYTNNKYIFIHPSIIKSIKKNKAKLLSWKEFKKINNPNIWQLLYYNFFWVIQLSDIFTNLILIHCIHSKLNQVFFMNMRI
ncbi:MAG TPA: hypothetical protein VGW78_02225 [Candidatus Babeliales bacterium]|jgi:hypothetical protein|nr:hypothetical protein [Candidatus Babeliales bacterium]